MNIAEIIKDFCMKDNLTNVILLGEYGSIRNIGIEEISNDEDERWIIDNG